MKEAVVEEMRRTLTGLAEKAKTLQDLQKVEEYARLIEAYKDRTLYERLCETSGPKQLQLINKFKETCQDGKGIHVYGFIGANRSAKSTSSVACLVWYIINKAKDGEIFYVISPSQEKAKYGTGVESMCAKIIPKQNQISKYQFGSGYTRDVLMIKLPDGKGICQIKFKFQKQDLLAFESDKITGVWFDEASEESVFDALIPRLVDTLGFLIVSTLPQCFWLKRRIIMANNPNYYFTQLSMRDNERNLTEEGIVSMDSLPEWQKLVRLHGEFDVENGLVFPMFSAEQDKYVLNEDMYQPPQDWPRYVMIDPGNRTTAVLWTTIDPDDKVIAYREIYIERSNTKEVAFMIKDSNRVNGDNIKGYYIDPQGRTVGASLQNKVDIGQQFRAEGIPIVDWQRTQGSGGKQGQVDKLRVKLADYSFIVTKDCKNLIRELSIWSYKKGLQDWNESDKFEHGNDHLIDCLLGFICMNKKHKSPEGGFVSVYVPNVNRGENEGTSDLLSKYVMSRTQRAQTK